MSKEHLQQWRQLLASDLGLQKKVMADTSPQLSIELAAAHGLHFSVAELEEFIDGDLELNDFEMDLVAGGTSSCS